MEANALTAKAVERQQGEQILLIATCPACHVQVSTPKDNPDPYCHGCGNRLAFVEGDKK